MIVDDDGLYENQDENGETASGHGWFQAIHVYAAVPSNARRVNIHYFDF